MRGGIVIAGLVAALLTGCSSSGSGHLPRGSSSTHTAAQPPSRIGRPFVNGGFQITVTKVVTGQRFLPGTGDKAAGMTPIKNNNGQYVLIYVTAKNTGTRPRGFDPNNSDSVLIDDRGRKFEEDAADNQFADLLSTDGFRQDQQPGVTAHGILAFDVPGDVTPAKVSIEPVDGPTAFYHHVRRVPTLVVLR